MSHYLGRKSTDADYGLGEYSFDADRLGLLDKDELTQRLIQTFSTPSYRPPRLPAVAMELLSLSQKPDVGFDEIQTVLEQDAMLAGEVLSTARSAAYSRTRQAATLREALVRLGLTALREVVLQAAMNMRVFRSATYGDTMECLRRHCRATAHICRMVARYAPVAEEQAFLCGLLHDVGFSGILLVLGDVKRGKKAPDLGPLWPAIDGAHAQAGGRMVELWGLPEEIATVVQAHHWLRIDGLDHPMAATVCLAEANASEVNLAFSPTDEPPSKTEQLDESQLFGQRRIDQTDSAVIERATKILNLSDSMVKLIRLDATEWLDTAEL